MGCLVYSVLGKDVTGVKDSGASSMSLDPENCWSLLEESVSSDDDYTKDEDSCVMTQGGRHWGGDGVCGIRRRHSMSSLEGLSVFDEFAEAVECFSWGSPKIGSSEYVGCRRGVIQRETSSISYSGGVFRMDGEDRMSGRVVVGGDACHGGGHGSGVLGVMVPGLGEEEGEEGEEGAAIEPICVPGPARQALPQYVFGRSRSDDGLWERTGRGGVFGMCETKLCSPLGGPSSLNYQLFPVCGKETTAALQRMKHCRCVHRECGGGGGGSVGCVGFAKSCSALDKVEYVASGAVDNEADNQGFGVFHCRQVGLDSLVKNNARVEELARRLCSGAMMRTRSGVERVWSRLKFERSCEFHPYAFSL